MEVSSEGKVYLADTQCTEETVYDLHKKMLPLLSDLTEKPFFRYYKVLSSFSSSLPLPRLGLLSIHISRHLLAGSPLRSPSPRNRLRPPC